MAINAVISMECNQDLTLLENRGGFAVKAAVNQAFPSPRGKVRRRNGGQKPGSPECGSGSLFSGPRLGGFLPGNTWNRRGAAKSVSLTRGTGRFRENSRVLSDSGNACQ